MFTPDEIASERMGRTIILDATFSRVYYHVCIICLVRSWRDDPWTNGRAIILNAIFSRVHCTTIENYNFGLLKCIKRH